MIVLLLSILLLMFVVGRYRRSLPDYKRDNNFLYVLSALKDGDETPDPGREWIPIDK